MKPAQLHGVIRLMEKLNRDPRSVQWWDLAEDPRILHSPVQREQLLQTGSAAQQPPLGNPFQGWQCPWFFWTVLKAGLALIAACFALVYGCQLLLNTTTQVAVELLYLIPPMVIPIVLMIFFWELNVPRNLTIWEVLSFFLVGTLLALGGNALMFVLVGTASGPVAALREEPAKLLAGMALLVYCSKAKGKQVCGLTGLVIGAAVGSGFSAFETISYGLQYDLQTVMVRVFFAVVGHTLYSCSYLAALALHSSGGKITLESFLNQDFLLTFGCSLFCHGLWNTDQVPLGVRFAVTLVLLWYSALVITRKSLAQLLPTKAAQNMPPPGSGSQIELRCLRGEVAGKRWCFGAEQQIRIGRGSTNEISLPSDARGISRYHCILEMGADGWTVTDTRSAFGTYIQLPGGSIYRLESGKKQPVPSGTLIYLGSQRFCLGISVFR